MTEYCDLVMKGGITSGVVYPKLIACLASKYDFKNIGGTSAGAIAASTCAAAQYGRHHENPQAFGTLAELPELLSAKVTSDGRSKLFSLFQPVANLRKHFAVLVRALNAQPRDAVPAVLGGLLGMHLKFLGIGLLLGSLLLWFFIDALAPEVDRWVTATTASAMMLLVAGFATLGVRSATRGRIGHTLLWAVTLLVLMALALIVSTGRGITLQLVGATLSAAVVALLFQALLLVLVVALFARGLLAGLHANSYGLCSGLTPTDAEASNEEGLTNWLTTYINTLAGLPPDGAPLTFGHLWGHNDPSAPRTINLEVMTTAISQQMVYGIPFRPGTPPFYYDPEEWAQLFPSSVMDFLKARPCGDEALQVQSSKGTSLCQLALHGDLPVVVAVRMSLSFPVLLSAIPLYVIDWSLKDNAERKRNRQPIIAKRVWFSDGGIGSNMPLHMFDSLLPAHPTFAVNLKPEHPDYPIASTETPDNGGGRIYLPNGDQGGRQRYWPAPGDGAPLGGLLGFLWSIVNTMQNWRDEIMFPYPGYRDRIVQISLRPDEGGLNLDMPASRIKALGKAGEMAADRLIDGFHPAGGQGGKGWEGHQKARLTTFLGTVQPGCTAIARSLSTGMWHSLVDKIKTYSQAERQLGKDFLTGVQQLGEMGPAQGVSLDESAPKPLAQLKIVPRI